MLTLLLLPNSTLAQAPPLPSGEQFVEAYLAALDAQAQQDGTSAVFDRQLLYLVRISGSKYMQLQLYKQVLDRIEAAPSPDSVSALAALLNQRTGGFPSPSRDAIGMLRQQATVLWYDLQWPDLSDEQRVTIALYGLYPDAPVQVWPQQSAAKMRQLGALARGSLYDLLLDPDVTYIDDWTHGVTIYQCAQLLKEAAFAPTDIQVKEVLHRGGDYGKAVMLTYLAERQDERAAQAIIECMIRESNRGHISYLADLAAKLRSLRPEQRDRLAEPFIAVGNRLIDQYKKIQTDPSTYDLFASLNRAIYRIGYTTESEKYFRRYLEFHDTITIKSIRRVIVEKPRFTSSIFVKLESAEMHAETALANWPAMHAATGPSPRAIDAKAELQDISTRPATPATQPANPLTQ